MPPVWFADSEETSITNAVQILSNTEGLDNHVLHQVAILLRELCRLHAVPEPPDLDSLTIPNSHFTTSRYLKNHNKKFSVIKCQKCNLRISSGVEQMEDEGLDSDADGEMADSDAEAEDSDADEDLAIEMEDGRGKADEMGVEHLATLERLRQNQRRDYLKVGNLFYSQNLMKKKHVYLKVI